MTGSYTANVGSNGYGNCWLRSPMFPWASANLASRRAVLVSQAVPPEEAAVLATIGMSLGSLLATREYVAARSFRVRAHGARRTRQQQGEIGQKRDQYGCGLGFHGRSLRGLLVRVNRTARRDAKRPATAFASPHGSYPDRRRETTASTCSSLLPWPSKRSTPLESNTNTHGVLATREYTLRRGLNPATLKNSLSQPKCLAKSCPDEGSSSVSAILRTEGAFGRPWSKCRAHSRPQLRLWAQSGWKL